MVPFVEEFLQFVGGGLNPLCGPLCPAFPYGIPRR